VTYDGGTPPRISSIGRGSQADYAYALWFNMVSDDERSNCVYQLLTRSDKGLLQYNHRYNQACTNHLSTGIMATLRSMSELTRNGHNSKAYIVLTNSAFPSWLYQITNGGAAYSGPAGAYGATTSWERWDGLISGATGGYAGNGTGNSFNHLWMASIGEWVYRVIGGLNRDDSVPAFEHFIVSPQPGGGITNAVVSFVSIHGPIYNSWSLTNTAAYTNLYLSTSVPANTIATIILPSTNVSDIMEGGQPFAAAPGVLTYWTTNGGTALRVGSGFYHLCVTNAVLQ
jgi:alpha-L-rhamnosidase